MIDSPPVPGTGAAPRSSSRSRQARRRFLRSVLLVGGVVGAAMVGFMPVTSARRLRLRPPGALGEADFLASCIKCGQCVQVCPVEAIKLSDIEDGFGVGVPHIDARQQACDFSCDAGQCILACPTGALVYRRPDFLAERAGERLAALPKLKAKINDPEKTLNVRQRLGVARLARPEACLAVQGKGFKGQARGAAFRGLLRYMDVDRWKPIPIHDHPYDLPLCDLCARTCPLEDAISIERLVAADGGERMTPVVHEPCIGCGTCEMICPVDPAAIVIEPRATWNESV